MIAIYALPVAQFPQITPPTIAVNATYTSGSANVVETAVTTLLEEQLNGVEGMIYMDSTSSSDGSSNINLYFKSGYDLNTADIVALIEYDISNRQIKSSKDLKIADLKPILDKLIKKYILRIEELKMGKYKI
jgi:multidrug efflux pump subunit AcrB